MVARAERDRSQGGGRPVQGPHMPFFFFFSWKRFERDGRPGTKHKDEKGAAKALRLSRPPTDSGFFVSARMGAARSSIAPVPSHGTHPSHG